jgi:hypothetical protein
MLLVERREMIESFLKELLQNVDYEQYEPLKVFMDAITHVTIVKNKIMKIIYFFRKVLAKNSLNFVSSYHNFIIIII